MRSWFVNVRLAVLMMACSVPPSEVARALVWTCALCVACGGGNPGSPTGPTTPTTVVTTPSIPVPPPATTCQAVMRPGVYALDADVGTPGTTSSCLVVTVSGVTLDCRQHIVNGFIEISDGLTGVSVTNCIATGIPLARGLTNVKIVNCTLTFLLSFREAHGLLIQNTSILPVGSPGAPIVFQDGGDNQVLDSVLDGGFQVRGAGVGADDGIILANEDHDTIRGNTIRNVFDAGIEGVNAVKNTTITANTISNAATAGIASYFCTAWQGNTIDGNLISHTARGLYFLYQTEKCFDNPPDPLFVGNVISHNTFDSPVGVSRAMDVSLRVGIPVHGNFLLGNNFAAGGVFLSPLDGFQNGGGNSCSAEGTFAC